MTTDQLIFFTYDIIPNIMENVTKYENVYFK